MSIKGLTDFDAPTPHVSFAIERPASAPASPHFLIPRPNRSDGFPAPLRSSQYDAAAARRFDVDVDPGRKP
ncbi:hypothetical protein [Burkholderia sp. 22PA0106]|uniref:hypothetical protein n=1 Tax=Burkholderia sp. 22PA0106 TaxID=3237371 RepID=UPI0039C0757B